MVLKIKRGSPPYMLYCLLIAAWLCVAQVLGNTLLILLCLAAFLLLTAVAAYKGFATPILLFFLPWSTLLRTSPDTISFYTLALGVVCVVCLVRKNFAINLYCILMAIGVFAVTMVARIIEGDSLTSSYIMFIFLLCFFPVAMEELHGSVDYKQMTIFFSFGIVAAALSAQQLVVYPKIARFIDVHILRSVTRLSGYYGDANFYAAHISAAMSGVLTLLLREKKGRLRTLLILLAVALLYCGLLSVSKSFILVMACVGVLWIWRFLSEKEGGPLRKKLLRIFAIVLICVVIVASGLFSSLWEQVMTRFSWSDDMDSLTTGRTELWQIYASALAQNARYLLLGRGLNHKMLTDHATHNTILQSLYQLGLIGTFFIILWEVYFIRGILKKRRIQTRFLNTAIILVGIFLPWMALDMLNFDEFFLMPMYAVAGILWFGKGDTAGKDRKSMALD